MYNLKHRYGETALVTGASSGIGKAFAQKLASEGLNLILVARRQAELEALASELRERYAIQAQVMAVDLSQPDAAQQVQEGIQWPVDILVNNAGYGSYGEFEQLDLETETKMVDLNCRQIVALTHVLAPSMLKQKKGAVIFLSSVAGKVPMPYMATYSATKAFNRYFALSLAGEYGKQGVDVLALCPGDTQSEFRDQAHFTKAVPVPQRTVDDVVDTALSSLGRRISVVDGAWNKLSAWFGMNWPEKRIVKFNAKMLRPKKAS